MKRIKISQEWVEILKKYTEYCLLDAEGHIFSVFEQNNLLVKV